MILGKSTLCSLLVRFYDPLNGQITIDGKDIRTLNATWLRSNVIGMINQVKNLNKIKSSLFLNYLGTNIIFNYNYGKYSFW